MFWATVNSIRILQNNRMSFNEIFLPFLFFFSFSSITSVSFLLFNFWHISFSPVDQPFTFSITTRSQAARAAAFSAAVTGLYFMVFNALSNVPILPKAASLRIINYKVFKKKPEGGGQTDGNILPPMFHWTEFPSAQLLKCKPCIVGEK